jgi:small-conductance mechanosensitive channel
MIGKLKTGASLVDQSPWQTAQALSPLAVSAEEIRYAHEAERLADHAVDQAFAGALRDATLRAQNRTLTGEALVLSRKVAQLQQAVAQDQALVKQLTTAQSAAGSGSAMATAGQPASQPGSGNDLDVAKAQLGLDSDELDDAQEDLDRASGDLRPQIQDELTAREAAMKKYDAEDHSTGETAVQNAAKYGTLAGRVGAWFKQSSRLSSIQQAANDARASIPVLTAAHNALEAASGAGAPANEDRPARLARIGNESLQRQLMSIYDDRVRTAQQLADVYDKWAAQVQLQHRILLHLMLQSVAWIVVILIGMVLGDGLVRRVMEYPRLERRQKLTLRSILELAIQIVGLVCILLVIFGAPQQTTEMIGLATAAITIALQDFVLAFFGWFVLMGKKGMRVGDTVEINGVGGEVIEIGLMSTTLLETGALAGKGYPTGRRISFMNGFAIRGTYFNFSTSGQWLWDELDVAVPAGADTRVVMEKVQSAVEEETRTHAHAAEMEWSRSARGATLSRRGAAPFVNFLSSGTLEVRYVTRASERVETRDRLHERVMEVLGEIPVAVS